MNSAKDKLVFLWGAFKFILVPNFNYSSYEPPEKWSEREFLKWCYWDKEADQLDKDCLMVVGWIKEAKRKKNKADEKLYTALLSLFIDRHNRIKRVQHDLGKELIKKHGRTPHVHGILQKNGEVSHYIKTKRQI